MHRRSPPTVNIPISLIEPDASFVADDRILKLYRQLHNGAINAALTRLPINSITSGYYLRQEGKVILISNLKIENVPLMMDSIRTGHRPTLDLYWSPIAPCGGGYVCADDEAALSAYKALNFTLVPCRILRPKEIRAFEAAIWIEKRGDLVGMAKAVSSSADKYASFLGDNTPTMPEIIKILSDICQETRTLIVNFHKDSHDNVHYHQMLHAFLFRHERILNSVGILANIGRMEHAGALVRVAYEAFLNFYIDWLSPEFFGPRLQYLSGIRMESNSFLSEQDKSLDILANFVRFLETTSEKARISPLGSYFHQLIYPPLSFVVHQSYAHLERESSGFDRAGLDGTFTAAQLGRWLDVLTAALLLRIRNDVGIATHLPTDAA